MAHSPVRQRILCNIGNFLRDGCVKSRAFSESIKTFKSDKPQLQRCLGQPTFFSHPYLIKEDQVTPGLSKEEYRNRRESLMDSILNENQHLESNHINIKHGKKEHVLIVLGAPVHYMTQDIPYPFHQNTNFSYLTGFQEPDSCLVVETMPGKKTYSTLFVQERDPIKELWNGARAGREDALSLTGIDATDGIQNLGQVLQKYLRENYVIWYDFKRMNNLQLHMSQVRGFLQEAQKQNISIRQAESPIHEQRHTKSLQECQLMGKACDIISKAFIETMHSSRPGINELELHAKLEYVSHKEGAQMLAFPPVVAGGDRANTLHYTSNNIRMGKNDLVLVDAGAHYHGYVSDITRTWPVSGKFTVHQQKLYEAVLRIQEHCITLCTPGQSLDDIYNTMTMMMVQELFDLGIIKDKLKHIELMQLVRHFCPHHVGHWLGMDVHDTPDIARSMKLLPGMVVTVEPGLYIREDDLKVAPEYRGIGIRIEDDVLITMDEPTVLSSSCPKSVDDIKSIMKK